MNPPNHRLTEMYLGTSGQRRDLLRREARDRRPHLALYTTLVVVLVVVATIVVGPGRAIDWTGTYLIPVGVITGVVIAALALLVQTVKRLPTSPLRDWYQ